LQLKNYDDWILILNLYIDRIYRINLIFLIPHFPEENEETQSDFLGKIPGEITISLIPKMN